jgi:chromosomal replication initiation ATPase DnaA
MKKQLEYIEIVVCAEELIDPSEIHTGCRQRRFNDTRQMIMYFATKYGCTQFETGEYFKRDHATVIHACKTVNNMYDTDKEYKDKIDKYNGIIKEGMMYKAVYLKGKLNDLKKEAKDIINEINKLLK